MRWVLTHEFRGSEYDWVATDSLGHLGYFTSAGFGGVPEEIVAFGERMYEVCDRVDALPFISEATLVSSRPSRSDWIEVARRGFFAFDWSYEQRAYELIAVPEKPLLSTDLQDELVRDVAERCHLDGDFSNTATLGA